MDNKAHLTKWLTGFLITLSWILTLNHFIKLRVDVFLFAVVTAGIHGLIYAFIRYRKWALRGFAVLVLTIVCIYALDYGLSASSKIKEQDLILSGGAQSLTQAEGQINDPKRHNVTLVHEMRDFFDYQNVVVFGKWLVQTRLVNHLIEGNELVVNKRYEFYLLILVSFLFSLLFGLLYYVRWLRILFVIPIALYVWLWYQFIDLNVLIPGLYFGGLVSFFIMDHHDRLIKAHPDYNTAYYRTGRLMLTSVLTGFVIVILAGTFTWLFPIRQVNMLVDWITPNLWGARSGYESDQLKMYSLKETPFQTSEEILGGPVGPINMETPIFWVRFDEKIEKAVYLKASIKDHYDGLKWLNHGTVYKNNFKYYLSEEDNVALLKSGAHESIDGSIRINRKEAKTVTLFSPMGLYNTDLGNERVYVSAENEAFYKAGAFVRFLDEYNFNATGRDFLFSTEVDYLQLSNRIEPRTLELAVSLGSRGETDYEKMEIITQFLSQNYTYSLTPLSNWERRDFVSSFLFETKKGYCTYFASALAIMARANGLPSRYVEGFRVDPNEVDPDGEFSKVTERDAHAWAEVYLEDYGWVIFESTPIYSEEESEVQAPSLEELLSAETDETPGSTNAAGEPVEIPSVNIDDLLAEMDGGRGDFNDFNGSGDTVNTKTNWTWLWVVLSVIFVTGAIVIIRKLPITYFRRKNTHAYAIRLLYAIATMEAASRGYAFTEPERVFQRLDIKTETLKLWLRILYDQPDRITPAQLMKGIDEATDLLATAKAHYKMRNGKIQYLKFRWFEVHKR